MLQKKILILFPVFSLLLPLSHQHMFLSSPPALKWSGNPHTQNPSDSISSPLAGLSQFPCQGHASGAAVELGSGEAASVAVWQAGSEVTISISGGAVHGGGSCQASLSYDGGVTFRVVHTWLGSCPAAAAGNQPQRGGPAGADLGLRIPSDAPTADHVLFAWTWFNRLGNREMYMSCAVVDIGGLAAARNAKVPFDDRPEIFVANVGNGCSTLETKDVRIPDPGPDVTVQEGSWGFADPRGQDCGPVRASKTSGSADGAGGSGGAGSPGVGTSEGAGGTAVEYLPGTWYTPGNDWPEEWNSGVDGSARRGGEGEGEGAATQVVALLAAFFLAFFRFV